MRLISSGYLEAGDDAEDLGGGDDLSEPRLTTRGVAAIAGTYLPHLVKFMTSHRRLLGRPRCRLSLLGAPFC